MIKFNATYLQGRVLALCSLLLLGSVALSADEGKSVYIPKSFADPNNEESQWCYARSRETENFVIFWEAGYGSNPATAASPYTINMTALINIAEKAFNFYADSLKFITRGASKTDKYKMIIRLYYSTEWMATGLGEDDVIGELNLSANAAQALGVTVAHEVGHCFQYQVYADQGVGGWRYGLGDGGAGGNGFWEQCAQWQAFKVLPDEQFTNYRFSEYLNNVHKHILHESPRYANYFIQDYWCYLHGMDFIGRLWRESKYPQDPVEAYQKINNITQDEFNAEIYDCAARFASWDIPALIERGKSYINSRPQPTFTETEDGYWQITAAHCPENYGHNIINLNVPTGSDRTVKVRLEGLAGASGYRLKNKPRAGWKFGFVALQQDGTRVYGDMQSASYQSEMKNPVDSVSFDCPENTEKLWLIVTGAPYRHWHHQWDDDDTNDEQWPYRVKFTNTNLYGTFDIDKTLAPRDTTIECHVTLDPVTSIAQPYPSTAVQPDLRALCQAFSLTYPEILAKYGDSITYAAIKTDGSLHKISTANAPGHWFNAAGNVTNWGNNSYVFSELNTGNMTFNIGQYPGKCKAGDDYTIRQALIYVYKGTKKARATFVHHIHIRDAAAVSAPLAPSAGTSASLSPRWQGSLLCLGGEFPVVKVYDLCGRPVKQVAQASSIDMTALPAGLYLLSAGGKTVKVVKR